MERMTLDQALFQRDSYQRAYEQCRADLDAARARVAELEAENRDLREIGLAARTYSESTRDRTKGDPNQTWRDLNDVLAYRGAALDAVPARPADDPTTQET